MSQTNNIKRDKVQAGSEDPEEDEKPAKVFPSFRF